MSNEPKYKVGDTVKVIDKTEDIYLRTNCYIYNSIINPNKCLYDINNPYELRQLLDTEQTIRGIMSKQLDGWWYIIDVGGDNKIAINEKLISKRIDKKETMVIGKINVGDKVRLILKGEYYNNYEVSRDNILSSMMDNYNYANHKSTPINYEFANSYLFGKIFRVTDIDGDMYELNTDEVIGKAFNIRVNKKMIKSIVDRHGSITATNVDGNNIIKEGENLTSKEDHRIVINEDKKKAKKEDSIVDEMINIINIKF